MTNIHGSLDRSIDSARLFRRPRRITITVPHQTHHRLIERSNLEGRSLSNLAAFLLEHAISQSDGSACEGD